MLVIEQVTYTNRKITTEDLKKKYPLPDIKPRKKESKDEKKDDKSGDVDMEKE